MPDFFWTSLSVSSLFTSAWRKAGSKLSSLWALYGWSHGTPLLFQHFLGGTEGSLVAVVMLNPVVCKNIVLRRCDNKSLEAVQKCLGGGAAFGIELASNIEDLCDENPYIDRAVREGAIFDVGRKSAGCNRGDIDHDRNVVFPLNMHIGAMEKIVSELVQLFPIQKRSSMEETLGTPVPPFFVAGSLLAA